MGSFPTCPFASASTVSFVLVQPSIDSSWNEASAAATNISCSASESTAASVVSAASMVAIEGASIAAPFAMPPTVTFVPSASSTRSRASLRTVSVVRMASAARSPCAPSVSASSGMPASMGAMGSGTPMRPVEHTSTSSGAHPRLSAVSSHIRRASRRPFSPVAALAFPELSTTAAARPFPK